MATAQYYGTGRRKTSTARVFLRPGAGTITVNRTPLEASFPTETLRLVIRQPLVVTETAERFDVLATTAGGGVAGQAGALRLGIARALLDYDAELRAQRCARPGCSRATRAPRNARNTAWPARASASSSASASTSHGRGHA